MLIKEERKIEILLRSGRLGHGMCQRSRHYRALVCFSIMSTDMIEKLPN